MRSHFCSSLLHYLCINFIDNDNLEKKTDVFQKEYHDWILFFVRPFRAYNQRVLKNPFLETMYERLIYDILHFQNLLKPADEGEKG